MPPPRTKSTRGAASRSSRLAAQHFQVPELLHLTFTFLPLRSLAACARVSRNWFSIAIEHLWKTVSIPTFLRLTASGRRFTTQLTPIRGPAEYEFTLSYVEAQRLGLYAPCITVLEFSYHEYSTGSGSNSANQTQQRSPDFYLEALIDQWLYRLRHHPSLSQHAEYPPSTTGGFTLSFLFPRLRSLLGATSNRFAEGCDSSEFHVPLNTIHGLLQPLSRIYRNPAIALSLIATTSTEIFIDSSDLRPSIFFEFKKNTKLRRLEMTRRVKRPIRDDWDKIKEESGWAADLPPNVKPPLRHLTLRAFDVSHLFEKLMDARMYGPVTGIRILRLQNFNRAIRRYSSTQSMTSRSDYVPRLVDTEDDMDDAGGSEPDMDPRLSSSPPNGSGMPALGAAGMSIINSSTAIPLTEAAVARMGNRPRGMFTSVSGGSQSSGGSRPPSASDQASPYQSSGHAGAVPSRSQSPASVRSHARTYSSSSGDDVDLLYPLGFNFFNDAYTVEGSESGSGSDGMSWSSTSESMHPRIPPPDRTLLEMIARTCPELEVLILAEAWDWDRLIAERPEPVVITERAAEDEATGLLAPNGTAMSRMTLRVDFRGCIRVDERAEVLVNAIKRVMKRKTGIKAGRRDPRPVRRL